MGMPSPPVVPTVAGMSKPRPSVASMPKRGIRVRRGDAAGSSGVLSVSWRYDSERGTTVWLRPATGLEMSDELDTLTRVTPS